MSWSYVVDSKGREIGYSVEAFCDRGGCSKSIYRGLLHACGGTHGETEYSCGNYFCSEHLYFTCIEDFCIEDHEPEFYDHLKLCIYWDIIENTQFCKDCLDCIAELASDERKYFYKHHPIGDKFLTKFGQVASKLNRIRSR